MSTTKNDLLQRVFGMLNDPVRTYKIQEDREVDSSEYQYCQTLFQILFGEKGLAQTLAGTWNMIHDPRFNTIESMMIVNQHAIFGGDARLGKQYINDDGSFSSAVSDLEKYAEILGEGRNFHNVLLHPDSKCQVRLWLERIYRGFTNLKPYKNFECNCNKSNIKGIDPILLFEGRLIQKDPKTFKDAPEEEVWALIKQECPNRSVTQKGEPTTYGKLMYNLIRADLIGLIHDYSETPLIDSYVYLQDQGVVTVTESVYTIDPHGQEAPRVLQEIDMLEQALTNRSVLRVTAYKLLKRMGFERKLAELKGEDFELTDIERDHILQIIYLSDYPEEKYPNDALFRARLHDWEKEIEQKVMDFVVNECNGKMQEREINQLVVEKEKSQNIVMQLLHGEIQPINQYTEPAVEIPEDTESDVAKYTAMMDAILTNEFKANLYLLLVQAEHTQDTAIIDILSPVFLSPDYPLDEQEFYRILERIRIGSKSLRAERMDAIRGTEQIMDKLVLNSSNLKEYEGEWHSKDNPEGMFR